ncbi:MAG: flagellar basal body L-ring protein FlgH [Candidatus Saganbacteria bacterium]|nr:flagellar basal body L-ring protein FlgH [Candidatus Saganbacteria bacterium]
MRTISQKSKVKSQKYFLMLGVCWLALAGAAGANSLWNEDSASPYSPAKAYKVGDIINVVILENTSAKNQATTKANVTDNLSAKFTHTMQRLAPVIGLNTQANGQLQNLYTGDGSTVRGNNVQARIAAWVIEVLPNGNLLIKGRHKVNVNDEMQEITLTGTVRPKDIAGSNTVYSYQVANAELTVSGSGAVSDTAQPGWLTRLFNWIF